MQREHIGLIEEFVLASGRDVAISARLGERGFTSPHQHFHAEGFAIAGNDAAELAVSEDPQRVSMQAEANAVRLPAALLQRGGCLRNAPERRADAAPGKV